MRDKNNKWSRREKKYGRNAKHSMRMHGKNMLRIERDRAAKRQLEKLQEEEDER